ncbi:MAG: hypothetical protein LBR62_01960 [Puniceicoccales bacterium]|nr:hypothetical protein [Puniceicoccales bacterium]
MHYLPEYGKLVEVKEDETLTVGIQMFCHHGDSPPSFIAPMWHQYDKFDMIPWNRGLQGCWYYLNFDVQRWETKDAPGKGGKAGEYKSREFQNLRGGEAVSITVGTGGNDTNGSHTEIKMGAQTLLCRGGNRGEVDGLAGEVSGKWEGRGSGGNGQSHYQTSTDRKGKDGYVQITTLGLKPVPSATPIEASIKLALEHEAVDSGYAHYVLGVLYEKGAPNLVADMPEATCHYRWAAAKGDASGQYRLGMICLVAKRVTEAIGLLIQSAQRGYVAAQCVLGMLHILGEDVGEMVFSSLKMEEVKREKFDSRTSNEAMAVALIDRELETQDRNMVSIKTDIARLKYRIRSVPGDGNCGIYALLQAFNSGEDYSHVERDDFHWQEAVNLRQGLGLIDLEEMVTDPNDMRGQLGFDALPVIGQYFTILGLRLVVINSVEHPMYSYYDGRRMHPADSFEEVLGEETPMVLLYQPGHWDAVTL